MRVPRDLSSPPRTCCVAGDSLLVATAVAVAVVAVTTVRRYDTGRKIKGGSVFILVNKGSLHFRLEWYISAPSLLCFCVPGVYQTYQMINQTDQSNQINRWIDRSINQSTFGLMKVPFVLGCFPPLATHEITSLAANKSLRLDYDVNVITGSRLDSDVNMIWFI